MSYKKLEIWKLAEDLVTEIHVMTLKNLPGFEMFEEGAQIRRSVKSVKSNIVEGYGRKIHPKEYLRFLTFAHSSLDETKDHLETLFKTKSLKDKVCYDRIHSNIELLGKKLYSFKQSVKRDC